jgi:hypothetical protein
MNDKIIGIKQALKLAKEVPGAKYLFLDQNGDWITSETYLKDFSNPKKVEVGELTRSPKNAKNLGSAGDVGGLDVIWVWDISTGKKMWDFSTTNVLKESYSFNQYLEFLTEGVVSDFSPDVKEVLEELPYVTFKNDLGIYATAKLDDVKRIGTYSCNIYPNSEKDIAVTISLKPVDSNKIITLVETVINIETPAWKNNFKKFINEARKIVEKLSELNQAD